MFRTLSLRTTAAVSVDVLLVLEGAGLTLIFANVLESKGQARVLSLYDADLAKRALADDT